MEFENLQQVRESWLAGEFKYPDTVTIADIEYHRRDGDEVLFEEMITLGRKGYVIYATPALNKEAAKEAGLNRWIVMVWGTQNGVTIEPYDIRPVQPERFMAESSQERIGDIVILKIMLPSGTGAMKGKVDTGADVCSLHAENINVVGDMVKFTSPELSQNELTLPVAQFHAVKSADGGTANRPVVELDIEINGKPVRRAQFNLNDRSQMEYPVLIGQNVLEKTNFLIDPNDNGVAEDLEWDEDTDITIEMLDEQFADIEKIVLEESIDTEQLDAVYNALKESDITLQDLVKYIRMDARTVLEDVDY